jgi:Domain of unknown function (DU1801)
MFLMHVLPFATANFRSYWNPRLGPRAHIESSYARNSNLAIDTLNTEMIHLPDGRAIRYVPPIQKVPSKALPNHDRLWRAERSGVGSQVSVSHQGHLRLWLDPFLAVLFSLASAYNPGGFNPRISKTTDYESMTKAAKAVSATTPDPEKQLQGFIDKFAPEHQALIGAMRKALRKRIPTANELVYDNYNFFVIGYSPTERPSDSVFSIAAAANGVGLSFYRGATLPDPQRILLGSGAQNRFLRFESAKTLALPAVAALIDAAIGQAKAPFAKSGKGKLIIRSISAKQRPRRKSAK